VLPHAGLVKVQMEKNAALPLAVMVLGSPER